MATDARHKGFLRFIHRVTDVPLGYGKFDLIDFRRLAERDFPGLAPLIDEYIRLAERSESDANPGSAKKRPGKKAGDFGNMHLFDLLRSKRLFASNTDLEEFAARILPGMSRHRFDKMSRGDIAARIVEYLETLSKDTREELEQSMREAMSAGATKPTERRDFFSKWEKIIKGIPL